MREITTELKIDKSGRIVIPGVYREELDVKPGQLIKITISNLKCGCSGQIMRIDESNPLVTYVGYANMGSLPGDAVWQIQRTRRFVTNDIVGVQWADGNQLYDDIWDQRLELNYQALQAPVK